MEMAASATVQANWTRSNLPASPPLKMRPAASLLVCITAYPRKITIPAKQRVEATLPRLIMRSSPRQITITSM